MEALHPPDRIRVYLNVPTIPPELRLPGEVVLLPARRFWTLRTLAGEMRRNPPNVLFVPAHVIPPVHPPSVVTIHDLGYLVEPECHEPRHRHQLEWTTRWNCRAAYGIVAVSESTRADLMQRLGVKSERIQVIHHGVARMFRPASQAEIANVRAHYALPGRFILAVGTIQPRKNLVRLIEAFECLAKHDMQLALVLAGSLGWRAHETLTRAADSPFHDRIHHLGYVSEGDLPALYSAATVTALPSLYEGFGMPALESMSCGTPVVAANRSSLPEVCGTAAILVNPYDSTSIANGIASLIDDPSAAERHKLLGFARAESFTWQTCAIRTLAFLRSIGDNRHR